MRAGGFPGNPGGLVVSIVKTAGGRAPAHQARGRGRSTWRPTERSRRCSDGTAGRRQRSAGGWTARSRRVSEYRRSGGIEPTRPRGGKGAPAGGTGGASTPSRSHSPRTSSARLVDRTATGATRPWRRQRATASRPLAGPRPARTLTNSPRDTSSCTSDGPLISCRDRAPAAVTVAREPTAASSQPKGVE